MLAQRLGMLLPKHTCKHQRYTLTNVVLAPRGRIFIGRRVFIICRIIISCVGLKDRENSESRKSQMSYEQAPQIDEMKKREATTGLHFDAELDTHKVCQ